MRPAATAACVVLLLLAVPTVQALEIVPVSPQQDGTVRTTTPALRLNFTNGSADPSSVALELDGVALDNGLDGLDVRPNNLTLAIPRIFALHEGNHTLNVTATPVGGGRPAELSLAFTVNLTVPPVPKKPVPMGAVVLAAAGGVALLAGAGAGTYWWARKTRRFTFGRHFLRHPGHKKFLVLYLPSGAAVLLTLGGLFLVASTPHPPRFLTEQVLVAGAALAVGPFGLASARATVRDRSSERAFAQFLFELADAVRGGIDPVKAVQELAKGAEGILKRPLHRAADTLRLGRPLDEALRAMVAGIDSPLVARYASLVGEAGSMGGSVAGVLQRAAKDMDDLVKIKAERRRALRTPVFTMYMAFGVMLIMILQIVSFAPNIGDLDLSVLTGGKGAAQVPRMPLALLQLRFYHLILLNAAGAGLLVGSFTEGKVRNGLLHAIAMCAVAAVVYPLTV